MGPWLRDNSEEKYFEFEWRPLRGLFARYAYDHARHGNEYQYINGNEAIFYPILKDNTWTSITHSLMASYELLTGCYLSVEYRMSDTKGYDVDGQTAQYYLDKFTPEFFQGKKGTVMVRVNVGF
jgi:hypothetical protein